MNEPIVYKRSVLIGQLALVQVLAPPIVAIGTLFLVTKFYGARFDAELRVLAVLIALLAPTVLRRPQIVPVEFLPRFWTLATSLLFRWILLVAVLIAIGFLTKSSTSYSRLIITSWAILTPVPLILISMLLHEGVRRFMLSPSNARKAIVAGYNDVSRELVRRLTVNPEFGIVIAGYFDDRSSARLGLPSDEQLLGGLGDLSAYVRGHETDVIFVALPMRQVQRVVDLLDELRDTTASIYFVPDVFVIDLIQSRTAEINGMPVIAMCETPFQGSRGLVKRTIDIAVSATALLLLSPLLLMIASLIKLTSPGPAIFRQRRYGLDGRVIDVLKFRTMKVVEDGPVVTQATVNDQRVTPLGRFLRRYSLDELPQLWNVLRGEMSMVGPRPHAVAHNEMYRHLIKGYMVRHKVPPGITGLAQVNGCRGETSKLEDMRRRIEYDLDYLRHWSPMLDVRIIAKTFVRVLRDRKAY